MSLAILLAKFTRVIWVFFIVTLPITSFPFLPAELGGKTLVRPLAIYPLMILLILVTLPRLVRKPLPVTFLPLLAFIVIAIASSVFSLALNIEAFKGVSMAARILRNLITLGIGVAIYFTMVLYNQDEDRLRFSLRWLYIGFAILLFWGSLQTIYVVYFDEGYFAFLNKLQSFVSTQELYPTRISGMTYEPKWFAEQITFVLMPFLAAAVISGRSVFKWRFRWISLELLMLIWAAVVMTFTFSRTGILALILLTFVGALLYRPFRHHFHFSRSPKATSSQPLRKKLFFLVEALLATLVVVTIVILIGARNPYFSRLWRYWSDDQRRGRTYLEYIAFGQRFVYFETALRIFEKYPILGVGPGNYAFYFDDMLPQRSYTNLPEVIRQITPTERGNQLITPKNLLARLLAETGLVGTITFIAFVIAILGCSLYCLLGRSNDPPDAETRYWGLAGVLGLIVFLSVIFSTDSFAIPNMWVVFGFATAAAHLPARLTHRRPEPPVETQEITSPVLTS